MVVISSDYRTGKEYSEEILLQFITDGQNIGSFVLSFRPRIKEVWLSCFGIKETQRGKGYGQLMALEAIQASMREFRGACRIHLHAANETAAHVYKKVGFKYRNSESREMIFQLT